LGKYPGRAGAMEESAPVGVWSEPLRLILGLNPVSHSYLVMMLYVWRVSNCDGIIG
jgi:hypothetical protein